MNREYSLVIMLALAIVVFLIFGLHRDRNPRSRFKGPRSWSRQANYVFVDGVVLILAMVIIYVFMRIFGWI